MTQYTANDEDMRTYTEIVKQLSVLDLKREQLLKILAEWEKQHTVEEAGSEYFVNNETL